MANILSRPRCVNGGQWKFGWLSSFMAAMLCWRWLKRASQQIYLNSWCSVLSIYLGNFPQTNSRRHPHVSSVRARHGVSFVSIKSNLSYHCNFCAMCAIVLYMTTIYRGCIVITLYNPRQDDMIYHHVISTLLLRGVRNFPAMRCDHCGAQVFS